MSAFLYGRLTAKREAAPNLPPTVRAINGGQVAEPAANSTNTEPPGISTYADIFTALVPAEVLAAALFFVSQFTNTTTDGKGQKVTVTDYHSLKIAFWSLAAASIVLYVAGHYQEGKWTATDFVRMLIPPLAFAGWAMAATPPTMFDAAINLGDNTKVLLVVLGGVTLVAVAGWLGMQASKQT
jgi:hypothetical protein